MKKKKKRKLQDNEKTTQIMGEIFANHVSNKSLVSRIHKMQQQNDKQSNPKDRQKTWTDISPKKIHKELINI